MFLNNLVWGLGLLGVVMALPPHPNLHDPAFLIPRDSSVPTATDAAASGTNTIPSAIQTAIDSFLSSTVTGTETQDLSLPGFSAMCAYNSASSSE